jgi:alkanesulfonate monooxygenase SsuD/methylene tetrahydromethanopterin reductase-like flavin-dependent oxidoreductase (luciferase family)
MRALLETRTPEFHGAHIDYSGVLFSPRPSTPIPIVVGGTSRAALKRAATLGDGWHGIWQSPGEVLAALATMDEFGRKGHFQISLRTKMRIGKQPATRRPEPASAVMPQPLRSRPSDMPAPASINWSSNPSPRSCTISSTR